jgi:hypothetical protein
LQVGGVELETGPAGHGGDGREVAARGDFAHALLQPQVGSQALDEAQGGGDGHLSLSRRIGDVGVYPVRRAAATRHGEGSR